MIALFSKITKFFENTFEIDIFFENTFKNFRKFCQISKVFSKKVSMKSPTLPFWNSPNFTSSFTSKHLTQRGKSKKLLIKPKGQCGGLHFHLPVTGF